MIKTDQGSVWSVTSGGNKVVNLNLQFTGIAWPRPFLLGRFPKSAQWHNTKFVQGRTSGHLSKSFLEDNRKFSLLFHATHQQNPVLAKPFQVIHWRAWNVDFCEAGTIYPLHPPEFQMAALVGVVAKKACHAIMTQWNSTFHMYSQRMLPTSLLVANWPTSPTPTPLRLNSFHWVYCMTSTLNATHIPHHKRSWKTYIQQFISISKEVLFKSHGFHGHVFSIPLLQAEPRQRQKQLLDLLK